MRKALGLSIFALVVAFAGRTDAAPRGTVIVKRTQQEFNDVEWEIRGSRVEVKLSYGSRFFPLDDLLLVPIADSASSGTEEEEEDAGQGPTAVAWHARCRLSPAEGWEPVRPTSPRRLIELKHHSGARLSLSLIPVEADFELSDTRKANNLKTWVTRDLSTSFHGLRSVAPGVTELFGTPVLGVGPVVVSPVGQKARLSLQEVRFRRFGFEYVLSLLVTDDDEGKRVLQEAESLFAGFSFLPAVSRTRNRYSDFGRGFSIRLPSADWEMVDRPFAPDTPVTMTTDGGRGELTVTVSPGDSAAVHVREQLQARKRKSKYYSAERVQTSRHDGAEVEHFQFEDFRAGGRKKLRFRGFSIALQGHVVTFQGIAPLTDEDARKIQEEIDRVLDSVRLYDKVSMAERLKTLQDSAAKLAEGYAALDNEDFSRALAELDDALSLNDGSALAFYLRAEAKRGLGDFDGFRQDLDRAMEIDPDGGYGEALGPSYAAEAKAAEQENSYAAAIEHWERAVRASPSNEEFLAGLGRCVKSWWSYESRQKGVDAHRVMVDIERAVRRWEDQPAVIDSLAQMYKAGANQLAREGNFAKGKRWAKKLRGLEGHRDDGDKLYDSIKLQEERARGR